MPTFTEVNAEISRFFSTFTNMLNTIAIDRRDEWPTNNASYAKGTVLSSGEFGNVKLAELRHPISEMNGSETRKCVIKTIYLKRRLEKILGVFEGYDDDSLQQKHEEKIFRFIRRLILDLYILNRCRHENIMHSHAVYLTGGDLQIVLPRFYVLEQLIEMYRLNHNAEPIPVLIIAKILRQICYALEYLQEMKIMHRDVQPENIYLTRNGTVKLAHFGQAKILLEVDSENVCKTPVGKETYMSFEKLHNLHNASSIDVCQSYSFPSDIWSLGVLVLSMVSYFPEEPFHKLPKDFALIMHNENMPFQWLTVNMVQLRARLNRSGGELLKSFLSRKLLTVNIEDRETASSLPKTPEMRKWCLGNVEEDKLFLRKKFIDDLDFANQCKIDTCVPNYDHLETKDIPPKFYWDDTWKELETREFSIKLQPSSFKANSDLLLEQNFTLSNTRPLFIVLNSFIHHGIIELVDIIPLDFHIRELCYELVEKEKMHIKKNSSNKTFTLEKAVELLHYPSASDNSVTIYVSLLPRYRYGSISSEEFSDDCN